MEYFSLFQLNNLLRATLDTYLDPTYWVVAEVSELRNNASGHCYLELVEKDNGKVIAKVRANIWANIYSQLNRTFEASTGSRLSAGMTILCQVVVQFHEVYGLSFNIKAVDPQYTLGEKARMKQEVIQKLSSEGLLEANKMRTLPRVVQNVALITSPTAAGYEDFMAQLSQNKQNYHIQSKLYPSIMQGDGAIKSITQAILTCNKDTFDAIVLIRGGGSQIDLDCYDNYELSKAIASSNLPVITGIGHERDQSVCDLVAHSALKTPTAVAEFLLEKMSDFESLLDRYMVHFKSKSEQKLLLLQQQIEQQQLRLIQQSTALIKTQEFRLDNCLHKISQIAAFNIKTKTNHLHHLESKLSLLNPETILQKGYSITLYNGKPIKEKPVKGNSLTTITATHTIESTITQINNRNEQE